MNRIGLITFGDGSRNWINARNRLMRQAIKSGYFHNVEGHSLQDLTDDLTAGDTQFIDRNQKEFGFCLFKPHSIRKYLSDNPEIDLVVYLDAGSEINERKESKEVFEKYVEEVKNSGYLGFQLDNPEKIWTKSDLFKLLNTSLEDQNSGQIAGGHLLFTREFALNHCHNWLDIMRRDNYHFLDNSPSIQPESDDFISHRYDQSISSLLLKKEGTSSFRIASEMEPTSDSLMSQTFLGPFVALRNASGYSRYNDNYLKKAVRKISTQINNYL
jgi:hypothetical protein